MKDRPVEPNARRAHLQAKRRLKMARSAHAYVRGSTERFYAWVESDATTHLPDGPSVWICGDCHVGNLGPIGNVEGAAVVELRDLDQSVIGNPAYDLVRLALSLAMAARSSDLPGVTTARMTEDLIAGYESAFDGERPTEEVEKLPQPIRMVMRNALRRNWKHLARDRLGGDLRLPRGRRFWPLSPAERVAVNEAVRSEHVRALVTSLEDRDTDAEIRLIDAAYWVKGCSSLGLWRAAALVEVEPPKGKKRGARCLLDFKEAVTAWAPANQRAYLPAHQGERVVTGARKIAPALGKRMVSSTIGEHQVFVRELLPQDLKVELDDLEREDGRAVARYLGMVVGRAHARQLDLAARASWMGDLQTRRTKRLEVPSWLWSSVVELVALHERAYLEHCRRFALEADRQTDAA